MAEVARSRHSHSCLPWMLQDPVCTPSGHLYSREAILENLLGQKKAIKRKLAAWEAQQADEGRKASRAAQLCRAVAAWA